MQSLAVKYRPKNFEDVVSQSAIKLVLEKQIQTKSHKNAYLFTGGAGTGKTTCARIFASELNDGKGNPIEIDAASNNGVENVRNIIDNANFKSLDSEYKVYIIDECHMLSQSAWNAMLKLLEEPPSQTIFVMCTTDPHKVPVTILSRVQRYDFRRIHFLGVVDRLKYIIKQENNEFKEVSGLEDDLYTFEDDAIDFIAKIADGGMRDAITLLDKCISFSESITLENVIKVLGFVNYDVMFDLVESLEQKKHDRCFHIIEEVHRSGADVKNFIKQFVLFLLDVTTYNLFNSFEFIKIPAMYEQELKDCSEYNCIEILREMVELQNHIRWESETKPIVQTRFLLLCE